MRGAIHTINILRMGIATPDAEGRGGSVFELKETVLGRVMSYRASQAPTDAVGRFGENVTVVAAVPLGTGVSQGDYVSFTNVDPTLNGTYLVEHTLFGADLELFCRWFGRN